MSRYDVSGSEGSEEPGADEGVLENLPGITSKSDIDDAETELLDALYQNTFDNFPEQLTFDLIKAWHQRWFGNLYPWAGEFRSVNMSKGDFHFAAANQLPMLASGFEADYLKQFVSLSEYDDEAVIQYLAESHVEFILIHPFREGNGRISRLLLDVMAVQAGFQPLDYTLWDENKEFYFKSIQAGVSGDYQHLIRLVRDVLEQQ